MKNVIFLLFLFIIVCIGCSNKEETIGLSGTYAYNGYTAEDVPTISGTLDLDVSDSTHVTGTWQLSQVNEENNVGPQIGTGNLEGGFNNDVLMLDLNPGWADNNVFLIGRFEGNTFSGTWEYSGFAGVINQGYFTAEKN